ncbi:hypothetical protein [Massilia sp. PWRC2]|uniref:hypothetical protein n=1 Tax=Massilia sp. PWRC2 TaxID=2804626 RepID=UPI003CF2C453
MNVGEYGISFNFNQNFTISGFTTLSLAITRPDGSVITKTNPAVSVGSVALVTPNDGTYAAGQYAVYVFADGDLSLPGDYKARLTYTDASKRLIGELVVFTVNA